MLVASSGCFCSLHLDPNNVTGQIFVFSAATGAGCVRKFVGEHVVAVEFAAKLLVMALGKHPRLPGAGHVKCRPTGYLQELRQHGIGNSLTKALKQLLHKGFSTSFH